MWDEYRDYFDQKKEKLLKLSDNPETKKEFERRAKSLSDERSRLENAKMMGILEVSKRCLDNGMSLSEVAKHTPYHPEELKQMLRKYNLCSKF